MIRVLRFTDIPSQLLPGRLAREDLAVTHDEMGGEPPLLNLGELARWSVAPPKHEQCLVAADGARLHGLAVLRQRRGPRAWEVAHLFAATGGDTAIEDLLERAAVYVSSQRGERLFLRMPYGSHVQRSAEAAGLRAAVTEDVFSLTHPMAGGLRSPGLNVRPPLPSDTYGIFRLYNATVPAPAKAQFGLTLDQWRDSGEGGRGNVREYVWDHAGSIRGWVRLDQRGRRVVVDALLHPDEREHAVSFVSYVAQLAWGHRSPTWIVPSHQPAVARALESQGWQPTRSYVVLARTIATPVEALAFAGARADLPGGTT